MELSRRERQIMDIVYRLAEASVAQVREQMSDPPSYSTVRALISTLERKGHLEHSAAGAKYVYRPTVPRAQASESALKRVVSSFFQGSPAQAAVALVGMGELGEQELAELEAAIRSAREEGR
jgi:predicted transcriptional regulator